MRKLISSLVLAATLAVGAANAQIFVRIGPPPPRREVVVVRPGPRYIWVAGYHRWDGNRYYWQPGAWVLPPAGYHRWVPGRWRNAPGGYYWVEGRWR